jgi:beta-lactamase class D
MIGSQRPLGYLSGVMRWLLLTTLLSACGYPVEERTGHKDLETEVTLLDTLDTLFTREGVQGSMVVHDVAADHWYHINGSDLDVGTLPASTFKIFSSLYGLESGVIDGPEHVLPYDGSSQGRPEIARDLSLTEAYHMSAYWYHRAIARQAGGAVIKHWLDTVGYGNTDTTGGFDRCWVAGALRITPLEQVRFLERLWRSELPFSERTMDLVKGMMVEKDTLGHVLRAKTGWAVVDSVDIGWYVGWVEVEGGRGPYFFATRLRTEDVDHPTFAVVRRSITMAVLARIGAWPDRPLQEPNRGM